VSDGLSFAAGYLLREIAPALLKDYNFTLILTSVIQYGIAFPLLWLVLRKIPSKAPTVFKFSNKEFLKYGAVCVLATQVGNYISSFLMVNIESALGRAPENAVNTILDNTSIIIAIVIVGIIGPIIEELMFRKLFIDRLTPYGDMVAVLVPSLIFGLFHANLYQFFYAFFLGAVFSYIYLRSGKIIYTTVLHIFVNLFFGVIPSAILSGFDVEKLIEFAMEGAITEEYKAFVTENLGKISFMLIYDFAIYGLLFAGVFVLFRNFRNIAFNKGSVRFPKGVGSDVMFFNAGAITLIAICLILMASNTFAT
jgi:membrane protease YdiL (CAAX protease family)